MHTCACLLNFLPRLLIISAN